MIGIPPSRLVYIQTYKEGYLSLYRLVDGQAIYNTFQYPWLSFITFILGLRTDGRGL